MGDDSGWSSCIAEEMLRTATLVFCTLGSAGQGLVKGGGGGGGGGGGDGEGGRFEVVIVDEAAQAVEAEVLVTLASRVKKILLVGDPLQLPATVISGRAASAGYDRSLMTRLMNDCGWPNHMLDEQYRMHPDIARFPR